MSRRSQSALSILALAILVGAVWLFNDSTSASESEYNENPHEEGQYIHSVSIEEVRGRKDLGTEQGTRGTTDSVEETQREEKAPKAFGSLYGAIYDAITGEMMPNHIVLFYDAPPNESVFGKRIVADAEGNYAVRLPVGEWTAFYAGDNKYSEHTIVQSGTDVGTVTVEENTNKLFDIALEGTRMFSGRFTFEESGMGLRLWVVQQPTQKVVAEGSVFTLGEVIQLGGSPEIESDDLDPKDYPHLDLSENELEDEIYPGSGHFWIQGLTPEVYEVRAFLDGPKANIERSILVATVNLFDGNAELEHRELTWADFGMEDWVTLPVERHK